MPSSFAADLAMLLGETGTSASLRIFTEIFDPVEGENTQVATDVAVTAVVSAYRTEEVDGSLVQRGDVKATIQAQGLAAAPTPAEVFVLGSEEWSIQSVTPRYAGGIVLSYALQLRR